MNTHSKIECGLIVKKIPYGDADEIITVLFQNSGLRRLFVTGSRKSKKRFTGLIDHLAHLKFDYIIRTEGLSRVKSVIEIDPHFSDTLKNIETFALVHYLLELILSLTAEEAPLPELYQLLLSLPKTLMQEGFQRKNVISYTLQVLEYCGYAVDFKTELHPEKDDDYASSFKRLVTFGETLAQKQSRVAPLVLSTCFLSEVG